MESTLYKNHPAGLKVIETLGFDPEDGFARLGLHLDRCEQTCDILGRAFDRANALQRLGEAVADTPLRVRMTVDVAGQIEVQIGESTAPISQFRVGVADTMLTSDDPWLQIKTTQRALYDHDRGNMPADIDELIYLNERGEVCEGTITNVFIRQDGVWVTPATNAGCLPGVLRQEMLEAGEAAEGTLTLNDLHNADAFAVGNSLRGLIPAILVP